MDKNLTKEVFLLSKRGFIDDTQQSFWFISRDNFHYFSAEIFNVLLTHVLMLPKGRYNLLLVTQELKKFRILAPPKMSQGFSI